MTAEVEVRLRKRYQCSICHRSSSKRTTIARHVKDGCAKDPQTHACPTCRYNAVTDDGFACMLGLLVVSRQDQEIFDTTPPTLLMHCLRWEPR